MTLEAWTKEHPILGKAWVAKESFYDIWDCKTAKEAREYYKIWQVHLPPELYETFRPLVTALSNWETEVFRHFDHGATNAYVEALNSVIRVVNRMGRGYSFEVLRARMLFAHGHHQIRRRIQKRHEDYFERSARSARSASVDKACLMLSEPPSQPASPWEELGVSLSELAELIAKGEI